MFDFVSKSKPDGHLPWWAAVGHALLGHRSIEYYPRLVAEPASQPSSLKAHEIIAAADAEFATWTAGLDKDALAAALERARESLDEVKALTEYQDQKATRLLTVATFLTALSGVLFNKFSESYPLKTTLTQGLSFGSILVILAYLAFGVFVLAAVSGALVTFHATRTRFKYPRVRREDMGEDMGKKADPASMLFSEAIIRVSPGAWVRAFVYRAPAEAEATAGGAPMLVVRADLQTRYLQNYVTEAYLIAAKTADKLRYLQPAQRLLSVALSCLLIWLLLLGLIAASIDATKAKEPPIAVRVEYVPIAPQAPASPIPSPTASTPAAAAPRDPTKASDPNLKPDSRPSPAAEAR